MKKSPPVGVIVGITLIIAIAVIIAPRANGATGPVGRGTPAGYSMLAGTAVTKTGPTTTERLPSTSTGDRADSLTILGVALTGIGAVLLRRRPDRHR